MSREEIAIELAREKITDVDYLTIDSTEATWTEPQAVSVDGGVQVEAWVFIPDSDIDTQEGA